MDLEFATDYFNQFVNFERIEPKKEGIYLENIQKICEYFGSPELKIPCIHVAGSKGKGSVVTMAGYILKAAGYKNVGLYRSPALTHFTDRISEVNGPFPEAVYRAAFLKLKSGIEKLVREHKINQPTYYELVTLFAFLTFKEAGCDFVVYEVGMGGRLDATNVVKPKVSVINTIELEHTKILGDTLEKIAAEKAGIIKEHTPVVIGPQPTKSVEEVFSRIATEKHSEIVFIPGDLQTKYFLDDSSHLKMRVEELNVDLNFLGHFQAANALTAATAVRLAVPNISDQIIKAGLKRAFLPGRFEILTNRELIDFPKIPYVILDGAHTENSVAGAAETLEIYREKLALKKTYDSCLTDFTLDAKPVLLFACAKDKNVEAMAKILEPHFSEIILTSPGSFKTPDLPRARKAFEATTVIEDYNSAIKIALETANQNAKGLVVLGSFYLVAEVKKYLEATPWS
ncbi:bifunctional folylpolyglutamate synthase/dihydrofolate synthase [Candidatus Saccharibacteria bacterium]|nr:bifunctional folylpolyglutamate synthase/dihydrofolate synthase [Candidatus Saccharibacteria bacterium]